MKKLPRTTWTILFSSVNLRYKVKINKYVWINNAMDTKIDKMKCWGEKLTLENIFLGRKQISFPMESCADIMPMLCTNTQASSANLFVVYLLEIPWEHLGQITTVGTESTMSWKSMWFSSIQLLPWSLQVFWG